MTIMGLMVYALAISLLLAPGAWLLDHGLSRLRVPTRWVWLGALALSLGLPAAALLRGPEGVTVRVPAEAVDIGVAVGPAATLEEVGASTSGGLESLLDRVAQWRVGLDRALVSGAELFSAGPSVERWAGGLWGVASLVFALVVLASMVRLAVRASGWPRETLLGRQVRVSPDLGPATIGLLGPEIVVPRWARVLRPRELDLVLTHEEEHVRSKDPLVLALGLLPVIACPWNPLIWWQLRRLSDAVEVDCDRRVLDRGAAAPRYGDLLVKLRSRARSGVLPVPTMSGSPSLLERRLTAMKKMGLRAAIPRALGTTIVALGLVAVACSTEAPVGTEDTRALVEESLPASQDPILNIRLERDGSVYVSDVAYPMADVSVVVGPLFAASERALIISIGGDREVPYQVMSRLQEELVAAGATRVVFQTTASGASWLPPDDVPGLLDQGVPMVLPVNRLAGVEVSQRNLLHLIIQPSGIVDVRRGADWRVQQFRPQDIEGLWRQAVAENPQLIAAVKTHPDAPYTYMVDVLDALHSAKAERISLKLLEN